MANTTKGPGILPANKCHSFTPADLITQEYYVDTATNMIPGRIVNCLNAGIGVGAVNVSPVGWICYECTDAKYTTDATKAITDAFAVGDIIAIHPFGQPMIAMLCLANGQNVLPGAILEPTANGELTAATTANGYAVCRAFPNAIDRSGSAGRGLCLTCT